jgi:AcrR family transcriptional regulator
MDDPEKPARRRRGGREPVTPQRVTDAAIAIIDAEGLDALTMRRLATDLGVEPMTIYRQLASKDAILASVAEQLWATLPVAPPAPGGTWRETFATMWAGLHGLMQAHPNAIPLIARGGGLSASAGAGTLGMLAMLRDAGLDPAEAGELVHALSACVVGYGFATLWGREAAAAAAAAAAGSTPAAQAPVTPPDLPPDVLPYLAALGRWDPGDFDRLVARLLGTYGAP